MRYDAPALILDVACHEFHLCATIKMALKCHFICQKTSMPKTRGRPPNKAGTRAISVTVPQRLYDYLTYLAQTTVLGASDSDVAAYILTNKVMEMLHNKFHEMEIPNSTSSGTGKN